MRVSKLPVKTNATAVAVQRNSGAVGVPPLLINVIHRGIRPSRAIAKRIRGDIISDALIVLIAASIDTTRMTSLPRLPMINLAASAAGIRDVASWDVGRTGS